MDGEGGGEGGQAVEGFEHQSGLGAGEVDAAMGTGEEGVSGDQNLMLVGVQANTAGGVAGGVEDGEDDVAESDKGAFFEEGGGVGGLPGEVYAEGEGIGGFNHGGVGGVNEERRAGLTEEFGVACDMVPVAVGVEYGLDGGVKPIGGGGEEGGGAVAGVDGEGVAFDDDQV